MIKSCVLSTTTPAYLICVLQSALTERTCRPVVGGVVTLVPSHISRTAPCRELVLDLVSRKSAKQPLHVFLASKIQDLYRTTSILTEYCIIPTIQTCPVIQHLHHLECSHMDLRGLPPNGLARLCTSSGVSRTHWVLSVVLWTSCDENALTLLL